MIEIFIYDNIKLQKISKMLNRKVLMRLAHVATIITIIGGILFVYDKLKYSIEKEYVSLFMILNISIFLILFILLWVLSYKKNKIIKNLNIKIEENKNKLSCPIKPGRAECPLGVVEIFKTPKDSIDALLDAQKECTLLVEAGNNIFNNYRERAKEARQNFFNKIRSGIKIDVIMMNYKNKSLISDLDDLRNVIDMDTYGLPNCGEQIRASINVQNTLREHGINITTYFSDVLCKLRIIKVDDTVYVSYYPKDEHALSVSAMKICKKDDPYNLYDCFNTYIYLTKRDIERSNREIINIKKSLILSPINENKSDDKDEDCIFCKIVKNESKERESLCNTIIDETDNFIVLTSNGHFVKGYLLIIPKYHYNSFAEVFDEKTTLWTEFQALLENLKNQIKNIFGASEYTIFEHGSLRGKKGAGNTIDHAHLHVIPKSVNFLDALLDLGHSIIKIGSVCDIKKYNAPYLLFSRGDKYYLTDIEPVTKNKNYQSQYLRRIAYRKVCGKEDNGWDWKSVSHESILQKTIKSINVYKNSTKIINKV